MIKLDRRVNIRNKLVMEMNKIVMSKMSTTITNATGINSPNLEILPFKVENKITTSKTKQEKKSSQEKSLSIFKQLIVITAVTFSFGGLGFGLALRYSNVLNTQNVPLNHISQHNSPENE